MTFRNKFILALGLLFLILPTANSQELNSGRPAYPILFVHGLNSSADMWFDSGLLTHLVDRGYILGRGYKVNLDVFGELSKIRITDDWQFSNDGDIWTLNFESSVSTTSNSAAIYKQSQAIEHAIQQIKFHTGSQKVILVGHSMGGLAIAGYVIGNPYPNESFESFFYNNDVAKILTLGTPFGGAALANLRSYLPFESDAIRDLAKSSEIKGKNVFLDGGYETEVGSDFSFDVNVNSNPIPDEYRLTGINEFSVNDWPSEISYFWLIGNVDGLIGDFVVWTDDQSLDFGESKEIDAFHISSLGCSEAESFDAIIEGLDEADDHSKAYGIEFAKTFQGFITHQGDSDIREDSDYYKFVPNNNRIINIQVDKSPVDLYLNIYDTDGVTTLVSEYINSGSYVSFNHVLENANGENVYYLEITGDADSSFDGIGVGGKACDSNLESARQPYYFRIDEVEIEKPNLVNASVTPNGGSTTEIFTFEVDVDSPDEISPESVSLFFDGQEYVMQAESDDFSARVNYTTSLSNIQAGTYNYYYLAIFNGQEITLNSGTPLLISPSADGYDIALTGNSTFSPSLPDFGDNINVDAWINNAGVETYDEVEVTVRLINPNGTTEDTDVGIVSNVGPTVSKNISLNLQMPNSGPDGTYRIVYTANGGLDESIDNNVFTKSFYLGELLGTKHYRAKSDEIIYNQGDNFSINDHKFNIYSVSNGQVVFEYQGDYEDFYNGELAIYEDIDVAIHVQDAYSYLYNGNWVEQVILIPLESTTNAPTFPAENLYFTQGSTQSTIVQLPSGYNYEDYLIIDEDGYEDEIDSWIKDTNELSGNRLEIIWEIPSDEPLNRHRIYFQTEYSNQNNIYNKIYLNIVAPTPVVNDISKNEFSADDKIIITGSNFTSTTGKVKFEDLEGTINSWGNTEITVTVPEGVENGILLIQNANGISEGKSYQVISSTGDPIVQQRIPDQSMDATDTLFIAELSNTFSDPNNDDLVFSSESDSGIEVLANELSNGNLVLYADSSSGGMYSVIISATDADNVVVADTFSVNVQGIITIPDLTFPENNAVEIPLSFAFDWSSVDKANSYELHVSNSSTFDSLLFSEDGIFNTELSSENLDYENTYYWRVRAEFGGSFGEWSDTLSFTTEAEDILPIIVSLPDSLSGFAGDTLLVPVTIDNPSEQNYESFQFSIGYDAGAMKIFEIDTVETLSNKFFLESNLNREGEVLVNGATDTELNKSGTLINLNVELLQPSSPELMWNNFSFNEGFPVVNTLNSTILIHAPQDCGDVTDNGTVTNEDATFILRHVVELDNLSGEDSVRADVTGNGWISSYDASQVLRFVVGKEHIFNCGTHNAKVVYKPLTLNVDWFINEEKGRSDFEIPIFIEKSNLLEAVDIELELPTGISFQGISETPENWMITKNDNRGKVLLSMVGLNSPESEQVAVLKFAKTEEYQFGSISSKIRFNDNPFKEMSELNIAEKPTSFSLSQNYPNPFNPSTTITYSIPEQSDVQVIIYNMLGQKVSELVNSTHNVGTYSVVWNASNISSGLYMYRLKAGNTIITKSMMLIK